MSTLATSAAPVLGLYGIYRSIEGLGPLLRGIDLMVSSGDTVAITGPSGSGKSTLLHVIGGLVGADSGRIEIGGKSPLTKADWQKIRVRELGFIFQESWLLPSLTVADNVELPMIGVVSSARLRRDRVSELLKQLGLVTRAHAVAAKLSGGERQRVAIARALANRPRLILADVPPGDLDSANTELVSNIIFDLCAKQGAALCLATHDQRIAGRCTRWLSLDNGRLESKKAP